MQSFDKKLMTKETIIKPKQSWHLTDFSELLKYKELFYIFTWRDLKVRYKQTLLGVAWVIFQPLITAIIFTFFFGRLAKIPSENLPYEVFVFTGLIFWTYFSSSVTSATNSFIENAEIIKKIYFPKEILPITSSLTGIVDLLINLIVLFFLIFYFQINPSPTFLLVVPFAILICMLTASGLGLLLASFNIKYRDVRYILPFFIQILLFLSPIIYPASVVRDSLRILLFLNPISGAVEIVRKAIGGNPNIDLEILSLSLFVSIVIFILGLSYFRRNERFFADIA